MAAFIAASLGYLAALVGEALQCGYHELQHGTDRRSVHNPHGTGATPSSPDVPAWPVTERHGYVWVQPGDASAADPVLLSQEYGFLSDPDQFATVRGYLHVKASYQLVVDNLLDLTHVKFIQPQFVVSTMITAQTLKVSKPIRPSSFATATRSPRSGSAPTTRRATIIARHSA